jgi:large subunit ribosomal protein L18
MPTKRVEKRLSRHRRVRRILRGTDARPRLAVYRSLHHIYAQVISDDSGRTLLASSTLGSEVKAAGLKSANNLEAAKAVGKTIAGKCIEQGIKHVVFDRSGFLYHGRVKALADAAREAGLRF